MAAHAFAQSKRDAAARANATRTLDPNAPLVCTRVHLEVYRVGLLQCETVESAVYAHTLSHTEQSLSDLVEVGGKYSR
jgi:hypothetical protein